VEYRQAPPLLGEHTEEVLRDVLGLPPEEIRVLVGRA
jgi:crotonobetainyl-CoA:carnitine CoA-transferase CaiB-like acyl-CoA transferase